MTHLGFNAGANLKGNTVEESSESALGDAGDFPAWSPEWPPSFTQFWPAAPPSPGSPEPPGEGELLEAPFRPSPALQAWRPVANR